MKDVLVYIAENLQFLWDSNTEENNYKITFSVSSPGSGCIIITSPQLRIQLTSHHGELTMEIEPAFIQRRNGYIPYGAVPIEIIQEAITGVRSGSLKRISGKHAIFLRDHLGEIVELMSQENWIEFKASTLQIAKNRADYLREN
ncbi:hypothetical protein [Propionibacterium australiense]|uniref:hypothetical protein n=1 Tax=Propionibacterium australiense TaxID=119981 RepID=UPI000F81B3DF|nr:hypothetical protein [Propionibacterium australiense]